MAARRGRACQTPDEREYLARGVSSFKCDEWGCGAGFPYPVGAAVATVAPHPSHKIQSIFIQNGYLRPALCKGNIRSGRLWTFVSDDRPWILEPSATGLCEPDLHVFAKLFEDRLERGLEAQAFSGREIGGDDDVLDFFVGHLVDVDLARQPAS